MGTLFKLLKNELLTLATLFFVITPFVGGMINDQRAPVGVQEFAYKAESMISGSLNSITSVGSPINLGMSSGGGGTAFYTNGAPIFMPGS